MGMREDLQETLRLIYQQTANQLEKFWKDKTGNLFSGNKINASALPVDGTTITVTAGPGGPVITAPAGGGSVTSVTLSLPTALFANGGSTVTSSGSLTDPLATQAAHTFFRGPTSGSPATPTFDFIFVADIPNLPASIITSGTFAASLLPLATTGAFGAVKPDGSTITISAGVISATSAPASDATPTSVGLSLIDISPGSGHPMALSEERYGAPLGVAPLDDDRQVPSLALPPLGAATAATESSRWARFGTVLSPSQAWEGSDTEEANVFYEDGLWIMFYSANNFSAAAIGRATSTDGETWTKYGSNPVIGQGGSSISGWAAQPSITKINGVWRAYYAEGSSTGAIRVATSGGGIAFTRDATAVLSPQGSVTQWANAAPWLEGTNSWKMLVEGFTGSVWQIFLATSTTGVAFTLANSGNPLTTLRVASGGAAGGPCVLQSVQRRNGLYHVWIHAAPSSGNLPTDIYHFTSRDLITWSMVGSGAVITHAGVDPDFDQVADPWLIEVGGVTHMYASGVHNANSTGNTILWKINASLAMVIDSQVPVGSYTLPVATSSVLGGVKEGAGVSIAGDGTISATVQGYAPMVLDDPGATAPTFIVNADGQPIMVPIS